MGLVNIRWLAAMRNGDKKPGMKLPQNMQGPKFVGVKFFLSP